MMLWGWKALGFCDTVIYGLAQWYCLQQGLEGFPSWQVQDVHRKELYDTYENHDNRNNLKIWESRILENLKLFECWYEATSGKFHTWFHVGHSQNSSALEILRLPSSYKYRVYMSHKWISCLDLGLILKLRHNAYADTSKSNNIQNPKLLAPRILDKRFSLCNN